MASPHADEHGPALKPADVLAFLKERGLEGTAEQFKAELQQVPPVPMPGDTEGTVQWAAHEIGVITEAGREEDLWDVDEHDRPLSPSFPNGAGLSKSAYAVARRTDVSFVPCKPYMKQQPPSPLPLESFELRVIYEAGRTGFEDAKDFPVLVGSVIAGRYQISEYLGSATFSTAVRCIDLKHNVQVCVKIIRNSKDFFDQSLDEIKLLLYLNSAGDADDNNILQLFDYFYYKEHMFLVCELLRDNLFEFAKFNREQESEAYFTLPRVQSIARQLLKALTFVHSLNLIHCDLKPENILIKSYSRCIIKLIDFGSSCYTTDSLSSYVQSRCYRAPEVVLGCPYDARVDVWSLGAILTELLTGHVLFHNDTLPAMLGRIAAICGTFPASMLQVGRHTCRFVTKHGAFFEKLPDDDGRHRLVLHHPRRTILRNIVGHSDPDYTNFIESCLTIDPTRRPTTEQLLKHPFITKDLEPEASPPKAVDA